MADEREGQSHDTKRAANEDRIQTSGRKENDAQPLNASDNEGGPERYPSVRQDDAVERTGRTEQVTGESRSFQPSANPQPRQGAGDTSPEAAKQEGFEGPQGDPSEGKR
ncbi:hypothetical protein [Phenylobacterium soli]|uniref:Uncharacterized protein n=1 Tax=Phenylobacterium soli TaxID=2170551 RepID=A0A328AGV5_9CAUL|nr:hypothetical protein [Phenylobacterium soli]RAK53735.1 hypothetical protein DJ017_03925 [Phenylobacterium soli]